jgi:phosphoenolpyruvate synthase/pyruvate phosphate dikinase
MKSSPVTRTALRICPLCEAVSKWVCPRPAALTAGGLVIDVGGPISHGAIVARELGIPCVINTRTGTRRLGTGDRVRVDGNLGEVTILARAPTTSP